MSDREDEVLEGLYRRMTEDWKTLQSLREATGETLDRLRANVAQALALGAARRGIEHRTEIPEANVRRWAEQAPAAGETAGAA